MLERAGKVRRSTALFVEALEIYKNVLGDDHPHTITAREWLAFTMYSKGDFEGALPFLKQVVEDRKRVQGEDHRVVASAFCNLANCFRQLVRWFNF